MNHVFPDIDPLHLRDELVSWVFEWQHVTPCCVELALPFVSWK